MKKQIFLSFKPDFFRPILYDIKKYEYRKRFCMEASTAYLYLSAPVQEIIGIMELGVPIKTETIIINYPEYTDIFKRTEKCIATGEKFAIPIESLQLYKSPIPISKVKQLEPSFHVPQCYLDISKHETVYKFLNEQEMYDIEFNNEHKNIYEDNFGITCKEMELTLEFKRKDILYTQNCKYNIIKSKYLTK